MTFEHEDDLFASSEFPTPRRLHRAVLWHLEKRRGPDREYRSLEEVREGIVSLFQEYNHDQPHHRVEGGVLHVAFLGFTTVLNSETLTI